MPISKSAKKALRSSEHKASVNRHRKEVLKSAIKKVEAKTLGNAVSALDKAAKHGIIHKNKAARLKSRLAKQFPDAVAAKPKTTAKAAPKKAAAKTATAPKKAPAKKTAAPKKAK